MKVRCASIHSDMWWLKCEKLPLFLEQTLERRILSLMPFMRTEIHTHTLAQRNFMNFRTIAMTWEWKDARDVRWKYHFHHLHLASGDNSTERRRQVDGITLLISVDASMAYEKLCDNISWVTKKIKKLNLLKWTLIWFYSSRFLLLTDRTVRHSHGSRVFH